MKSAERIGPRGTATVKNREEQEVQLVRLVDTSSAGDLGSMARYGNLVEHVLSTGELQECWRVDRWNLDEAEVNGWTRGAWLHHLRVARKAFCARRCLGDGLFHVLDGSHAYVRHWLPAGRTVVTAHDVIPWLQMAGRLPGPKPSFAARWLIRRSIQAVRGAARVVAVSHRTAADLVIASGIERDRVVVVESSIAPALQELAASGPGLPWRERLRRPGGAYVLHVGHNGFYKNRAGVVRVFGRLRESNRTVGLKMAGPAPSPEVETVVRELGLGGSVEFIEDPSDEQLANLYREAALLVFPSIYEGFGWPPLEAMLFGCPVVASDGGALPEVIGEAGLCAAAEESMSELCGEVFRDARVGERMSALGRARARLFGIEKMGRGLAAVYEAVRAGVRTHFCGGTHAGDPSA